MPATPSNLSSAEWSNREQVEFRSQFHALISFLIIALFVYLQSQDQSRKLTPSDEYGKIMSATYVFLPMYGVGLMAEFKLQIPIIRRFTPLIGILVAVLLLRVLLPSLGIVAFIIWAMFMGEAIITSLQEIFQRLRYIYSPAQRTMGSNFDIEENHPLGNEENDSTVPVRENTD